MQPDEREMREMLWDATEGTLPDLVKELEGVQDTEAQHAAMKRWLYGPAMKAMLGVMPADELPRS